MKFVNESHHNDCLHTFKYHARLCSCDDASQSWKIQCFDPLFLLWQCPHPIPSRMSPVFKTIPSRGPTPENQLGNLRTVSTAERATCATCTRAAGIKKKTNKERILPRQTGCSPRPLTLSYRNQCNKRAKCRACAETTFLQTSFAERINTLTENVWWSVA